MMKALLRSFEKYFWFWAVLCTVLGLFLPRPFRPIQSTPALDASLMAILFFTCLKIDFKQIAGELKRPLFIGWVAVLILFVMPLVTYPAARMLMAPEFALGFLILAAVPAGMAGGAFTDLCKGNTSLALTITMVTSLLCPFTIPPLVRLLTGQNTPVSMLLKQSGMLMLLIFVPLVLAQIFKMVFRRAVKRMYPYLTPLSIMSLCLLILGAMSKNSGTFRSHLDQALLVLVMVFCFSGVFHCIGYYAAFRRPLEDRVALSVDTAYVNNGLAIVFTMTFFKETPQAVLPAILIEFPMILALVPLRYIAAKLRKARGEFTAEAQRRGGEE